MELASRIASRPIALESAWTWGAVLGIGLVAVLAGNLPPGVAGDLARQNALRVLGGDFGLAWAEIAILALVAAWIVAKPLGVIAAFLWLEFRISPRAQPGNYVLAWTVHALVAALYLWIMAIISLLDIFPEPLIRIGGAGGTAIQLSICLLFFIFSLLIIDFFEYWHHRALHHFRFLWRFHSLHHSLDVDILHSFGHPFDQLIAILLVGLPTAFLIGVSQEQLYLLVALTSLQAQINHTRLPIHFGRLGGTLFSDNRFHFIHHSPDAAHWNKNFAERFPVFDMLFGTYFRPSRVLVPTGLPDKAAPRSIRECLTVRLADRPESPAG